MLTENDWLNFHRDGFLHLGPVLTDTAVEELKRRADDLAMGVVKNPDVQMQIDTGGVYEDLPAAVPEFQEGTRLYRKIQGLENDPLYLRLIKTPVFLEVCAHIYGRHAAISLFRAMIMNKPAGQGTTLPWRQDGGQVWALDRDPLVTIWVALDEATQENGCLRCIPGSHHLGLLSQFGSSLSREHAEQYCPPDQTHPLEVQAGHAILIHNWLIHGSGMNPSPVPRRAFTMCCMDARTRSTLTGSHFPVIVGALPAEESPYLAHLVTEKAALLQAASEAVEYAKSLEADNRTPRQMRGEIETYALSLQTEVAKLQAERSRLEGLIPRVDEGPCDETALPR